jgi:nicotinamidase-related amidase
MEFRRSSRLSALRGTPSFGYGKNSNPISRTLSSKCDARIRITIKGARGCETIPELSLQPDEAQVIKKRYSAFFGTQLDRLLLAHAADTVVLAGINTHACVRTTAIDAYQRDLDVIIPREAVGSYDRDHEAMS